MKKTIEILHKEFATVDAAIAALADSTQATKLKIGWDDASMQGLEFDLKEVAKSILDKAVENDLGDRAADASAISIGERGRHVGDIVAIGDLVEGSFEGRPFYGWQVIDQKTGQPAKRRDGSPMILGSKGLLRGLQIVGDSVLKAEAQKPLREFYSFVSSQSALKVVAKEANTFGGFNYLYTSTTL